MKAVGIGILRDSLDGGNLLNALRKSLAKRREDRKQRGTGKGESNLTVHQANLDPEVQFCLPGFQTLV